MNNDASNQSPESYDEAYTNDPMYLFIRYKAYEDSFEDDNKKKRDEKGE